MNAFNNKSLHEIIVALAECAPPHAHDAVRLAATAFDQGEFDEADLIIQTVLLFKAHGLPPEVLADVLLGRVLRALAVRRGALESPLDKWARENHAAIESLDLALKRLRESLAESNRGAAR